MVGSPVKCRFCDAKIVFIETPKKKQVPCDAEVTVRHGSLPLPPGRYFDEAGENYGPDEAPCKHPLYLSHWAKCPGANQARKSDRKGRES